jgi:FMN phosphatase YigB (HAD superfamily)
MILQRVTMLLSLVVVAFSFAPIFGVGQRQSSRYNALSDEEKPKLALLTFDLDDTLFPVSTVVEDANLAMIRALHDAGYTQSTNASILRHIRGIRSKSKRKMTYTEMRKRAIQQEMESMTKPGEGVDYDLVHKIYSAWLDERHRSAERNLFTGTIEMLETIKIKFPYTCIAAITNGRGNPLEMTSTLAPYFEFCISGEDSHVFPENKPQRGIFKASVAAYHQRYPHKLSTDAHIWCHVGDCLVNDIWGSARNGAQAVWIEVDDLLESSQSQLATNVQPKWSTASPQSMNSRRKLASKGIKDVSAKISTLSQLPDAIDKILEKQYVKSIFLQSRGSNKSEL